jgi:hypothetical protein
MPESVNLMLCRHAYEVLRVSNTDTELGQHPA